MLNLNKEAQGDNSYKNKLVAQQEAYNEIFKGGANAVPLKPDGSIDYKALNAKIKEIKGYAPNIRVVKTDNFTIEDIEQMTTQIQTELEATPEYQEETKQKQEAREKQIQAEALLILVHMMNLRKNMNLD